MAKAPDHPLWGSRQPRGRERERWSPQVLSPMFLPSPATREGKWFPLGHTAHEWQRNLRKLPGAQPSVLSANGLCSSDPPAAGRQLQTSRDLGSQCRQLTSQSCGEVGFISPVLGQPPCKGRTQATTSAQVTPWFKNSPGPALSSQASHPGFRIGAGHPEALILDLQGEKMMSFTFMFIVKRSRASLTLQDNTRILALSGCCFRCGGLS